MLNIMLHHPSNEGTLEQAEGLLLSPCSTEFNSNISPTIAILMSPWHQKDLWIRFLQDNSIATGDISLARLWEHWTQNITQQFPRDMHSLPRNKVPSKPTKRLDSYQARFFQFLMYPTTNNTNFISTHFPRERHPDKSSHCPAFNIKPVCQ
jgi:hypothetical protein